jgi:hypothetical protein
LQEQADQEEGDAVNQFITKHSGSVIGTLSGFDRLVFTGTLRHLAYPAGLKLWLWAARILLKDFAAHAEAMTRCLKEASEALARRIGRPILYVRSAAASKEAMARKIAREDGIEKGLICILTAVEPCWSFQIRRGRDEKRLFLEPATRKCLFLYHYQIHPLFGFMHARIQTWAPFRIQICLNGREWLARTMDKAGLGYVRRENCFTWLEDPARAQRLMNRQVQAAWPDLLDTIAHQLNPAHEDMFRGFPVQYYWSAHQSEWATDILFRDARALAGLYPKLVQHGLTTFLSPDVMRFLGRNIPPEGTLPPRLAAEVTSDVKRRPEGVRIRHRLGENSIKMYDKQGSVLRVETTINDPAGFKVWRTPEGKPRAARDWHGLRKGIADLHRRAGVSQAANERYLEAMASVENTRRLGALAAGLCRPARRDGRRARALNPLGNTDARLFEAIGRGEFAINGFRNRDLRQLLFADTGASRDEQRRDAARVSRLLSLLWTHKLIARVHRTHRYHLTKRGRTIVTALITIRNVGTEELTKLAA